MPVKNIDRLTMSNFEGKIVDLTEDEIQVVKKALQSDEKVAYLINLIGAVAKKVDTKIYTHLLKITLSKGFLYLEIESTSDKKIADLTDLKEIVGQKKLKCAGTFVDLTSNPFTFYEFDMTKESTIEWVANYYDTNGTLGDLTLSEMSIKSFDDFVEEL